MRPWVLQGEKEGGGGGGQVVGSRMWSPPGYDQPVPHLIVSPRADKKKDACKFLCMNHK